MGDIQIGWASLLITLGCAIIGFLFKRNLSQLDEKQEEVEEKMEKLTAAFNSYQLHIAEKYVTTHELTRVLEDLNETMRAIFNKLDSFRELLDRKVDK